MLLEDIIYYSNVKVIDTRHSLERIIQRNNTLSKEEIQLIFKRGIDKIKEYANNNMFYLIYSKEFQQGIVIKYKKGKSHDIMVVVTFLPNGKSFAKKGTKKVVVEQIICKTNDCYNYVVQCIGKVEDNNNTLNEKFVDGFKFDVYMVEDNIYDLTNVEVVEIL